MHDPLGMVSQRPTHAPKGVWSRWVGPHQHHGAVKCQHGHVHGRVCACCSVDRPTLAIIECPEGDA